ncbi:helix-turn-helix domain-containing protein [Chryseobacterium gossypii]|uniref:helix-turn-helix domain-containing protein n=1 Tax=Chryseobacterium gossypii TaxID=3231602 RepID=UPI003525B437
MYSEDTLVLDQEIKDSFKVRRLCSTTFHTMPLVNVTYNRIFIIHQGQGKILIDHKVFDIRGSEIFLISKGQVFSVSSETGISGFEISFGDCFWEKTPASASNCKLMLFNDTALHQKIPLRERDLQELNAIMVILQNEFEKEDYPNKLDAMAACLKIIMIKLANLAPSLDQGIDDYDNRIYRKFLELVSLEYDQKHDVLHYAEKLAVTPRKLSYLCKVKTGKGAKEIIAGQIIAGAKRLLQFSAGTIKEIAYELSFSTPEQFSHFFKKHTGVYPADYRRIFVNIGR